VGSDFERRGRIELDSRTEEKEGRVNRLKEKVYVIVDKNRNQDGEKDSFNTIETAKYGSV